MTGVGSFCLLCCVFNKYQERTLPPWHSSYVKLTSNGKNTSTYTATYDTENKGRVENIDCTPEHENDWSDVSDTHEIKNTKLASLPSTGGIGTTIFTVGGCAIMIIAAGLYFATRRKSAK